MSTPNTNDTNGTPEPIPSSDEGKTELPPAHSLRFAPPTSGDGGSSGPGGAD